MKRIHTLLTAALISLGLIHCSFAGDAFASLKKSLTGDWADVTIETGAIDKSGKIDVTVNVTVKDRDISVGEVYLNVCCLKTMDKRFNKRFQADDDDALSEEREVCRQHLVLGKARKLAANSKCTFQTTIQVAKGQSDCTLMAGLKMKGHDPHSRELTVHLDEGSDKHHSASLHR